MRIVIHTDDIDVFGARPPVVANGSDGIRWNGAIGRPEHFHFGAVDGVCNGLPEGFEVRSATVVFDIGGIIRIGGDVPVHFVGEAEPDDGGAFGKNVGHGSGDFGGGDLVEGDEGLEGDGKDGTALGCGRCGATHYVVAVVAGRDNVRVVPVSAGCGAAFGFILDGVDVDAIG